MDDTEEIVHGLCIVEKETSKKFNQSSGHNSGREKDIAARRLCRAIKCSPKATWCYRALQKLP
jgi:hypothetical protein